MSSDRVEGICKLCLNQRVLRNSHVWPQFLYKRYISDQAKGGTFVDIHEENPKSNTQLKRYWLCDICEQNFSESENSTARLLACFRRFPERTVKYDANLLKFAVSVSWRSVLIHCEQYNRDLIEYEWPSVKVWRLFLDKKADSILGYSQHAFLLKENNLGFSRMLGSSTHPDHEIIITQLGPLHIVAKLGTKAPSTADRRIWDASRIRQFSGTLNGIDKWQVGRTITLDFARLLAQLERKQVMETKRLARKWGWPTS